MINQYSLSLIIIYWIQIPYLVMCEKNKKMNLEIEVLPSMPPKLRRSFNIDLETHVTAGSRCFEITELKICNSSRLHVKYRLS